MENEEIKTGIPTGQPEGPDPEAATLEECYVAARQLQKWLEEKPFSKGGAFFMEGLVKHGELEIPEGMSPTVRVFRAVHRLEMTGEDLGRYGFIVPQNQKRVYQLEVSLVCDTIVDDLMAVEGEATNTAAPTDHTIEGELPSEATADYDGFKYNGDKP